MVTVRESNASDNPGDLLYTLTHPANLGSGIQTFTAPAGATLEPSSSYFVFTSYTGSGDVPRWKPTSSDDEDSLGHPGCPIGDSRFYRPTASQSWVTGLNSLKIRVNTEPSPGNLVAAPDKGRVVLQWDTAGSDVTNYLMRTEVTGGSGAPVEKVVSPGSGTRTTTAVGSLTDGTEYTFSVLVSEVSGGNTLASGMVSSVTETPAVSVPATPTGLTATAGDG